MKKLLITTLLLSAIPLQAAQSYGNLTVDEVRSVYDGDTFKVIIKDLHPIIGDKVSIRVNGVDTPEMRGKCKAEKDKARLAKQHTVAFLRDAKKVELRNIQRGKYFRVVADVYADGKNLTNSLIDAGLGVPYTGKSKKQGWCKK